MNREKVALVKGVSSGIGPETASLLREQGFRTFGTLRETSRVNGLPPCLETVQVDVRKDESVRSCVRTVLDRVGRIDALVINAGCALIGCLEETTLGPSQTVRVIRPIRMAVERLVRTT
jgi:NADP-dependent 3-hydroxy acid dehydrogenase YdfG